jgi:hypothetical protein
MTYFPVYREEVLREHVPSEEEEWLCFEMSKLTQFTRIFPPLPKSMTSYMDSINGSVTATQMAFNQGIVDNNENEEEEENKEEEEDEENNNQSASANAGSNGTIAGDNAAKKKSATYEEIIHQVSSPFLNM